MLLGVARGLFVARRIHKVYRVALPLVIGFHILVIYLYLGAPARWLRFCQPLLG